MPTSSPPPEHQRHVLIVDDEEVLRMLARDILEEFGYLPTLAATGEEALAILADQPGVFDVVVIDLRLPGMTGAEAVQRIASLDPAVAIVAMSGLDAPSLDRALDGAVVSTMLTKPFRMSELIDAIERAVHPQLRSPITDASSRCGAGPC